MSMRKRLGWLGVSAGLGLLLVALLHTGLAGASGSAAGPDALASRRGRAGSKASPPIAQSVPSIIMTKTVGRAPGVCATSQNVLLPPAGGTVTYCYTVRNTGTITMTHLDLVDDQLGTIFANVSFVLVPGAAGVHLQSQNLVATTRNVATFTVRSTYTVLTATASGVALAVVPDLWLPIVRR
jgi:uncharacterized repeat protein (TIGR01451 family)